MKFGCFLVALTAASMSFGGEDLTPRVGVIEIYGARKVSANKIRSAIAAKPGDALPARGDIEERVDKISGVVVSRAEAACCDGRDMVLYVGIAERDTPHVEYHPTPAGNLELPGSLFDSYRSFLDEVAGSIRGRNADEDLTNGYSLMADQACRDFQQGFTHSVAADFAVLNRVVRESADPEQRAAAAYLLQYGPRGPHTTKDIVDGLQWALRDQDDTVRENAMRSLKAVAVGARLHPEQGVRIEPTWLVELMNSVVWSDRRDASRALVDLTELQDPGALALLRQRALPSVIEMARWHDLEQALPAFILAGRLAGLNDRETKSAWVNGEREAVLKRALNPGGKHSAMGAMLHHPGQAVGPD